jgi:putative heme-binding domain-containing protein
MFLVEQRGKIYSFVQGGNSSPDLCVDLKKMIPKFEAAYGLAFHPDFQRNRQLFICYIVAKNNDLEAGDPGDSRQNGTRVSRFILMDTDPPQVDVTTEELLLTWKAGGHNGGCLKFGPSDGYLYISAGDAAAPTPPDPDRVGQDLGNFLSCILRIDVDHKTDALPYRIPEDNPFVEMVAAKPEIWAYGFRNPWKMSFDRQSGDLWVGDVGWELWEMIYRIEKGGNYGWSIKEGPQVVLPEQDPGPTPIRPPVVYHPHSEAASITGGFVYRGTKYPELVGTYVYGDYQSGIVWGLTSVEGAVVGHRVLASTTLRLVAFGEDRHGELYLVDHRGQLYSLIANSEPDQSESFPRLLSETGLFESVPQHQVAAGVVPYSVVVEPWADHTTAERWLAVPGKTPITIDTKGNWKFPDGSVVFKTVSMHGVAASDGEEGSTVHLETQLLHREAGSWRPYTYVWNREQQDAELAHSDGTVRQFSIRDPASPNGLRHQDYRIAGRKECFLCHNSWVEKQGTIFGVQSASLLGVNSSQLARLTTEWRESGLLGQSAATTPPVELVDPYDVTADLDERARSYLQVNCAHCHQFNAGGVATLALAKNVALNKTGLIDTRPAQGTFGLTDARIVTPGDPYSSILLYRIAKTGGGRMPRMGSAMVDTRAIRLFHDWIANLQPSATARSANQKWNMSNLLADLQDSAKSRQAAYEQLTQSTRGALALATHIDGMELSISAKRRLVEQAGKHSRSEISDLFERFLPASERRQRLGTAVDSDTLLAISGDVQRGRDVFLNNTAAACKNCHTVGQQGHKLGPALDAIGKKYTRRQLLDQILDPSKLIEPAFVPYLLETTDGIVLSGLLEAKNDREVVLRDAKRDRHTIQSSDIELLVRQQKSLMPDLLLRDLTKQEVADLLSFLGSLRGE